MIYLNGPCHCWFTFLYVAHITYLIMQRCSAGNLIGPSVGGELRGDATSSGPVKLEDLQRILSSIEPEGTQLILNIDYCCNFFQYVLTSLVVVVRCGRIIRWR